MTLTTWKFRIKDGGSGGRRLKRMSWSVNRVWNFAKATQIAAFQARSARLIQTKAGQNIGVPNCLSSAELDTLVAGSSKLLGLHSQTVQAVTQEYVTRRKQFKSLLRWRGKRTTGWIPFKAAGIRWGEGELVYNKRKFRYWKSRSLPEDAQIKCGSFTADSRGRWYVNLTFESAQLAKACGKEQLGVDPGIKTLAALSSGKKIAPPRLRQLYLKRLRNLERTRAYARRKQTKEKRYGKLPKTKQMANLAAQIKHQRLDYLHKESTKLIVRSQLLVMGNLSCRLMNRNKKLSGVSLDSGLGMFRHMLRFKSDRDGAVYREVSERDSTQTCSSCGWQHPPGKRIGLGVRHWVCGGCAVEHDRDTNAAKVILQSYLSRSAQGVVRCQAAQKRGRPRESSTSKNEQMASF